MHGDTTGRGYLLYLIPSIVQGGVGLALLPVTTHYLEPSDFGVYALMLALVMPVRAFAATGTSWVIGGHYFSSNEHERRALLFNVLAFELILRSSLILLYYIMAEPVLHWLVQDYRTEYLLYLHIVLAATLAGSLWPTISFLMTVRQNARLFALVSVMQIIINAIATIVLLEAFNCGVESLFMALLISACASAVFELVYVYRQVAFTIEGKWLREVVRTGLKATPGGMTEVVSNMIDRLAIQRWSGLGALGLYSHSQQYLAIFKMSTSALTNTLMADGLRIYAQGLNTTPITRLLSAWYGMLALVGVSVALYSDNVIALLTHGKFTEAASLVQIWFLLVFSVSQGIPYATYLMAKRRSNVLMYTQLFPTIVGIGVVTAGVYTFGVYGAAWGMLLTNVVIQTFRGIAANRLGYSGTFERRLYEGLTLYVSLCFADYVLELGQLAEIVVGIVITIAVALHYNVLNDVKYLLSARAPR